MRKGRFIVFEGPDGAGKTTQAKLLFGYLKKNKIPAVYFSFPRYEGSIWGGMVKRYLNGDFGKLDGYLASLMYAGDRFSAAGEIRKNIDRGRIVVCDRYIASNIGHQAGKFTKRSEQEKFIKWLEKLEYGENNIPKEDLVIYLSIPTSTSIEMMSSRKSLDLHESDLQHLVNAQKVYERVAKQRKYWQKIICVKDGSLLPKSVITEKVVEVLRRKKYI